jgi:hypothetical protein
MFDVPGEGLSEFQEVWWRAERGVVGMVSVIPSWGFGCKISIIAEIT